MTDHQQPGLGAPPAPVSPFVPVFPDEVRTPVAASVAFEPPRDDRGMPESEPISVRYSMPADFVDIDLADEKAPSAEQLARRARLQRAVLSLVALLGIFDVVMLWTHYR
jgi:hypothetical protein